jgi:acyl-CoA reductase-like NAD-dependent aldehyde dehydrogenase
MSERTRSDERTAGSQCERFYNLINGRRCQASAGEWLESINPATGRVWAQVPASSAADVDEAVAAAKRAFDDVWSRTAPLQRAVLLRRFSDVIEKHADRLAALIMPWNAPFSMFAGTAACALAAGCTLVVKPPESASCSSLALGELFAEAGFPDGVVNIVSGLGAIAGDRLAAHPDVGKVAFTGSTLTARSIIRRSAEAIKPLSLELGGKSANIIFPDADRDAATIGATTAAIFTSGAGQACIAGSRILVHRSIHDEMVERFIAKAKAILVTGGRPDRRYLAAITPSAVATGSTPRSTSVLTTRCVSLARRYSALWRESFHLTTKKRLSPSPTTLNMGSRPRFGRAI